jgi:hypothetical protein
MFTRIFSAIALLSVVSACSDEPKKADASGGGTQLELDDPLVKAEAEAEAMRGDIDDNKLACAVSGASAFSRVCGIERSDTEKGLLLTIRHPDGGFRRLLVVKDGRGVIAADGAETAVVTPIGAKEIEVTLAGNRYRIPATVKGAAAPKAAPAG